MNKGIYKRIQDHTKGHFIRCSAIEDKNRIYLGLENEGDAEGLCLTYYDAKTKGKWAAKCRGGYYRASCCVVPAKNNSFLLVGWKGDVFAQHGLKKHSKNPSDMIPNLVEEQSIPLLSNCPLASLRVIDAQAYAVGAWRTIFRRDGIDNWTCLHGNDAKEVELLQKNGQATGFNDIGGFSKNDIYACGEAGDLWHYNGEKWGAIDAPTNKNMISICCTPTGIVYIACDDGTLIEGRDNSWNILKEKTPEILDIIWYQKQLYIACGMYGLYQYDGARIASTKGVSSLGKSIGEENALSEGAEHALEANGMSEEDIGLVTALSSVEINSDILMSPRTLATDGEILLLSDNNRVVAFNGSEWKILFVTHPSDNGGELW